MESPLHLRGAMSQDLVLLPEEEELAKLKVRLAQLEDELADREVELATQRRQLAGFLAFYLERVGTRLAELDGLEVEIAALLARGDPTPEAEETLREAQQRADDSTRALGDDPERLAEEAAASQREIPVDLKQLYRQVAKAVHPDLALDEEDRKVRERLMGEANTAYAAGDVERLRSILGDWESRPEVVGGEGVAAELVRHIRAIAAVEARLAEISDELEMLCSQDTFRLFEKTEQAREEGRDLIAEMVAEIEERIALARAKLDRLKAEGS